MLLPLLPGHSYCCRLSLCFFLLPLYASASVAASAAASAAASNALCLVLLLLILQYNSIASVAVAVAASASSVAFEALFLFLLLLSSFAPLCVAAVTCYCFLSMQFCSAAVQLLLLFQLVPNAATVALLLSVTAS